MLMIILLLKSFSGQSWEDKVERVRDKLREEGCSGLVCTALDETACKPAMLCHMSVM